jgi:hypothetical protein
MLRLRPPSASHCLCPRARLLAPRDTARATWGRAAQRQRSSSCPRCSLPRAYAAGRALRLLTTGSAARTAALRHTLGCQSACRACSSLPSRAVPLPPGPQLSSACCSRRPARRASHAGPPPCAPLEPRPCAWTRPPEPSLAAPAPAHPVLAPLAQPPPAHAPASRSALRAPPARATPGAACRSSPAWAALPGACRRPSRSAAA